MSSIRASRRRFLAAAFVAVATCAGCLSPTLPLPPPSTPEVSAIDSEGNVTLTGSASAGAIVYAYNDRTGNGAINTATARGGYELKLGAKISDEIEVWQELSGDRSSSVVVRVK